MILCMQWAVNASLGTSTVIDFFISITMCYYLRQSKGLETQWLHLASLHFSNELTASFTVWIREYQDWCNILLVQDSSPGKTFHSSKPHQATEVFLQCLLLISNVLGSSLSSTLMMRLSWQFLYSTSFCPIHSSSLPWDSSSQSVRSTLKF